LIPEILSIPCNCRVVIRPIDFILDTLLRLNFWGKCFKESSSYYLGLEKVRVSAGLIVLGSTLGFQKGGLDLLSSGILNGEKKEKQNYPLEEKD